LTFIAAELGANWGGNVVILDRMIRRAKLAGCNAVKFQALSRELLARHTEWDWYHHASVTPDNIETIDRICKTHKIEWFCTPTYPDAVGFVDPYVKRWKIRHADNECRDIINQCDKTGKEIIVSVDRPKQWSTHIKQIYCIPKYPTDFGEINFDMIKRLPGWSNHCLNPMACLKAVRKGAEYIEFHLSDDLAEFAIDNKVAFSYSVMDELVRWIRLYNKSNQ